MFRAMLLPRNGLFKRSEDKKPAHHVIKARSHDDADIECLQVMIGHVGHVISEKFIGTPVHGKPASSRDEELQPLLRGFFVSPPDKGEPPIQEPIPRRRNAEAYGAS